VRGRVYYGWYVLGVAALAMVGTLPGRTQGLGLVTEPLLADLGLDRVTYASVNFWATMIGALGAAGAGRLLDRVGTRVVLTGLAVALGAIVCVMSRVSSVATLAVAMTLTRAVGQSALSVVSIAIVGHWFVQRINMAMGLYSVALSIGFMIAFPLVGSLVQQWGWRPTWLAIGVALLAGLAPISWLIVRRSPEAIGLRPDGDAGDSASAGDSTPGAEGSPASAGIELTGTRFADAMRTGAFWVFAVGAALYGLVASGIGLFNEAILAERGFGPDVYYQTLVVTAMTALAGNFLGGWLAERIPVTRLMAVALCILALGVAVLPHVSSMAGVMAWATAMGLGGGLVMVLFFSVWPKFFGRLHLGRIQGAAQALTVLASALGPLLLAWSVAITGGYAAVFRVLAGFVAVTAIASLLVNLPVPSTTPE
jgi:MFS family permease